MSDPQTTLDRLAGAKSPGELIAAHKAAGREIKASRRKGAKQWGALASAFGEAMRIWDAQRANGVPLLERLKGFEQTIRAVWPQTREWKYLCTNCADYGLVISECPGDATCGRSKRHLPHDYGTPCWCSEGRRYKEKPRGGDDDFTAAGKTPKRQSGFTRMGR